MRFTISDAAPMPVDLDSAVARALSETRDGQRLDFSFIAFEDFDVIRVHGAADYYLWPDRIVCHLHGERHAALVPVHLFGMVLSLWLERQGVLTLHAAAVVDEAGAIALLAEKGGGKTSTAAALVTGGSAFLTDDLLSLTVQDGATIAHPAYPQMRMSPEQATALHGTADLPVVNPTTGKLGVPLGGAVGRFAQAPAPLVAVYLPRRGPADGAVTIEPLSQRDAFLEVVRHTFLPREMSDLGLQRERFHRLGALVATVPFRRMIIPGGIGQLRAHARRLVEDARTLA